MLRFRTPLSTFSALATILFGVVANAQSPTASVTGVVRTASGTPVAAARVSATNASSPAMRSAATDANGRYVIAGLAPGAYSVTASAVGFRRATRSSVRVDNATTVDLVLDAVPLNAITVTATLREQELKDVPFSIAAPTGAQLAARGAESIEDIATTQAGFSVQNLGPGQSQVAMRGTSSGWVCTWTVPPSRCRCSRLMSTCSTSLASRCFAVRRARCSAPDHWPEPFATSATSQSWA
jgi:hypothetical protein